MAWKRRRPTWPYLAILCFLFAVTLAAPESWRRRHGTPTEDEVIGARAGDRSASDDGARHDDKPPSQDGTQPAPALPPLVLAAPRIGPPTFAGPDLTEPTPAGPMVASDDYAVIDEPLVEPTSGGDDPALEHSIASAQTPPSAVAESFASRPGGRSVLVRDVPAPTAPTRPPLSVESLIRVRDALLSWVKEVQQIQTAARPALPRVVVESESDRLAMIPDLADPMPAPFDSPAPGLSPAPTLAAPHESAAATHVHRPTALIEQLQALQPGTAGGAWAAEVLAQMSPLIADPAPADPTPAVDSWRPTLEELRRLAQQGFDDAMQVADPAEQSAWVRAARALDRRLPVWNLLLDPQASDLIERPRRRPTRRRCWKAFTKRPH